jgi:hypothetical protein
MEQKHFFIEDFSGKEYNDNLEELKKLEEKEEKRKKIWSWILFILLMSLIGYLIFYGGFH